MSSVNLNVNSNSNSYTLKTTTANQNISANTSDNSGSVSANATIKDSSISFLTASGTPYYVGARAYVVQTADGAILTLSDYEGTTTAEIKNGEAVLTDYFKKLLDLKVDKEDGKGLSSNDFSTDEKAKLDSLFAMTDSEINDVLTLVFEE